LSPNANSNLNNKFPSFDMFEDLHDDKSEEHAGIKIVENINDSLLKSLQRGFRKCADMINEEGTENIQNDKFKMVSEEGNQNIQNDRFKTLSEEEKERFKMIEVSQLEIKLFVSMTSNIQKEIMYHFFLVVFFLQKKFVAHSLSFAATSHYNCLHSKMFVHFLFS